MVLWRSSQAAVHGSALAENRFHSVGKRAVAGHLGHHSSGHLRSNQCFLTYPKRNFQRLGIPGKDWGGVGGGEIRRSHLGSTDGSKHREHPFPVSWQRPSKFQQILWLQVLRFVTPQRVVRFQLVILGSLIPRQLVSETDLSCLSLERGPFKIFCLSIYLEMFEIRGKWFSLLFTSPASRDLCDSRRCRGNARNTLRLT